MDQPPSARKEARCERMNSSEHLSGSGSAGLSGDTLIPTGRDISHLTSSQESFAGSSRHLLNHHWLNHNVITSACEGGPTRFQRNSCFQSNCRATAIELVTGLAMRCSKLQKCIIPRDIANPVRHSFLGSFGRLIFIDRISHGVRRWIALNTLLCFTMMNGRLNIAKSIMAHIQVRRPQSGRLSIRLIGWAYLATMPKF